MWRMAEVRDGWRRIVEGAEQAMRGSTLPREPCGEKKKNLVMWVLIFDISIVLIYETQHHVPTVATISWINI